jgi:hypothetical protein
MWGTMANKEKTITLVAAVGEHSTGPIVYLSASAIAGITQEEMDYLIEIGIASGLQVIIHGFGGRKKVGSLAVTWDASVEFFNREIPHGVPFFSLWIMRPCNRSVMVNESKFLYGVVQSWVTLLNLSEKERAGLLRNSAARNELRTAVENCNRDPDKGSTLPPSLWQYVLVGTVSLPENESLQPRSIKEIGDERGFGPADKMPNLAQAENFTTQFRWRAESPEWTAAVDLAEREARMTIGTSDGGAHLSHDDDWDWSSYFFRTWVHDYGRWSLEVGICQITQVPAALIGLTDRGTMAVSNGADIMILDPQAIGSWKKELVYDLPGGVERVRAWGRRQSSMVS